MDALKNCPFCGGPSEIFLNPRSKQDGTKIWMAHCKNAFCTAGFYTYTFGETQIETINRYNLKAGEVMRKE